eukprot:scaffold92611_cov15-Tisochrysis_lutea.AAC.1
MCCQARSHRLNAATRRRGDAQHSPRKPPIQQGRPLSCPRRCCASSLSFGPPKDTGALFHAVSQMIVYRVVSYST